MYGNYTEGFPEVAGTATFTVNYPAWNNTNTSTEESTAAGIKTWKNGVSHNFGLVFYDDRGRSSFVKELGSVYVKNMGERLQGEGKGRATITANLSGITAPTWAKNYSIVYGGNNQIDDFIQYYVADGFQSWYVGGDYTQTYISGDSQAAGYSSTEDWTNKIFVSLKNWESTLGYSGNGSVDYSYKYRKGDVLRVIRYSDSPSSPDAYTYPDSLEFKIIDKVFLTEDMKDATAESLERLQQAQENYESAQNSNWLDFLSLDGDPIDIFRGKDYQEQAQQDYTNLMNEYNDLVRSSEPTRLRYSGRNPIFNGNYAPCKGWFLVLEPTSKSAFNTWNANATLTHVTPGESALQNHMSSTPHFHPITNWGKKVLVEIYKPSQTVRQSRIYREIGIVGSVNPGNAMPSSVTISGGDVWWKATPLL
jgi:hypothetical protein